jgi:hypothetical protein
MTRLMLLSVVAWGLAGCGGEAADDTWNVEAEAPVAAIRFDDSVDDATPAQRFVLLLTGGVDFQPETQVGKALNTRESSPDPMPGKPSDCEGPDFGGKKKKDGTGGYR